MGGSAGPGSRPERGAGGADVVQPLVGGLLRQSVLLHGLRLFDLGARGVEPFGGVGQRLPGGRVVLGIQRIDLAAEHFDPAPRLGTRVIQRSGRDNPALTHVVKAATDDDGNNHDPQERAHWESFL